MTVLDTIIENKRREVEELRKRVSTKSLEKSTLFYRSTCSLSESLLDRVHTGIIAEFKRKSPSAGLLNLSVSLEEVVKGYDRSGASGISILTDTMFFGGTCNDLHLAREVTGIPLLRKDFIIDELQVLESKSAGADAILLIAAVLDRKRIFTLSRLAHSLGMEIVYEIHEENELGMVNKYINIIGVNNRHLKTMTVDTDVSLKLAEKIPDTFIRISESGISDPRMIFKLRDAGYNGFLIGETFMKDTDPVLKFKSFAGQIKRNENDKG